MLKPVIRPIRKYDLLLNVLLPLAAGVIIYFVSRYIAVNIFIRNQLADGLWAYALMSAILIIWNRTINLFWVTIVFIFFILIEAFQYYHIIEGTADYRDVLIYFIFSSLTFLLNKYFKPAT